MKSGVLTHNPAVMESRMHFIQIPLANNKSERKLFFAWNNTQSLVQASSHLTSDVADVKIPNRDYHSSRLFFITHPGFPPVQNRPI